MMDFKGSKYDAFTCATVNIVTIEGNIGVGKSTLLKKILQEPARLRDLLLWSVDKTAYTHAIIVPEPVAAWTAVGPQQTNLLSAMYADPERYGLACQLNILHTQLRELYASIKAYGITPLGSTEHGRTSALAVLDGQGAARPVLRLLVVTERSPFSARNVFVRALCDRGHMSSAEEAVYDAAYACAMKAFQRDVDALFDGNVELRQLATVLLLTPPEVALERAHTRKRNGEEHLTLKTIADFDRRHTELFMRPSHEQRVPVGTPVVAVNADVLGNVLDGKASLSCLMARTFGVRKASIWAPPVPPGSAAGSTL